jgi:hypothetical protein
LSAAGELFEKLVSRTIQKHTEERNLTKCKSVSLQSRSQYDTSMYDAGESRHPNFNKNISTAAVFLDIEKALYTTRHSGLLYKLSSLECLKSTIKLIASFHTDRKFKVLRGDEFSTPRRIAAGVHQGSVLPPYRTVYT